MKDTFKLSSGLFYCAAKILLSFASETAIRILISFIPLLRMKEMNLFNICADAERRNGD